MTTTYEEPKLVVVPVDYGELSMRALKYALELAAVFESKVLVVFAWAAPYAASPIASDDLHKAEENLLELMRKESAKTMVQFIKQCTADTKVPLEWRVVSGDPRSKIVEIAKEGGADLIVTGSHNRGVAAHLFLGSVAEAIVRHAHCPTLVIR